MENQGLLLESGCGLKECEQVLRNDFDLKNYFLESNFVIFKRFRALKMP